MWCVVLCTALLQALKNLMHIITNVGHSYVPAIVGMADAFLLLKQTPKARNQLKRVSKMKFDEKYASGLPLSSFLLPPSSLPAACHQTDRQTDRQADRDSTSNPTHSHITAVLCCALLCPAAEFERAWLMLAELYIQTGKFDMAQKLCKKALEFNRSSAKAWEQMGRIMEKEQVLYISLATTHNIIFCISFFCYQ